MRGPRPRGAAGAGAALILALALAGAMVAADARADAPPFDEETERSARAEVIVVGLARAPERALLVYPSRCTDALRGLAQEDEEEAEEEAAADADDADDYAAIVEGEPIARFERENYCDASRIYAVPRALLDELPGLSPRARQRLFADDPRIARARLGLLDDAPVVPRASRLALVRETLRVLAVTEGALLLGVESHAYTFTRGRPQTLAIGAAERPDLPERPLSAAAIAGAMAAADGWESRVLKDMSEETGGSAAPAAPTPEVPAAPVSPDEPSGEPPSPAHASAGAAAGPTADQATDDDPPPRPRMRLWITTVVAGLVSVGSLLLIRRRRRPR